MGRGIDHLVLASHDLDALREVYGKLGFTTTPRAQHDWGTDNSLVQLQGCFLELLTVGRPERLPHPEPGRFHFGLFNRDYLEHREGFSMIVFESQDAAHDRTDLAANGIKTYAPFGFERQATLPDGSTVTVAFSLAFFGDDRIPDAGFFTCQQHAPQHFWKPDFQRHANEATQIAEATMVAEDPHAFVAFYGGFQGEAAVHRRQDALWVETPRGVLHILTPRLFEERYGTALPAAAPTTPHWAGFVISVPSLETVAGILETHGIPSSVHGGLLCVAPEHVFGTAVAFSETPVS